MSETVGCMLESRVPEWMPGGELESVIDGSTMQLSRCRTVAVRLDEMELFRAPVLAFTVGR